MTLTADRVASKLSKFARRYWPQLVCFAGSLGISCAYLIIALRDAGSLGFPLDDAYIYLTYAKQIGRLEPMSYYPGGPYSAGATSPLWPFLLAPLWSIGFRGTLFVYAAFAMSAVMVATATALAFSVVERIADRYVAAIAAVGTAMCGAFTYASLSAMEVGLAASLLFWVVLKLIDQGRDSSPRRGLLILLAMTSLARPELTLLVGGFVTLRSLACLATREPKLALRWLLPLLLPLAWVVTNKLIAGNFFPNTGVAKSHFYLPGFNLDYYFDLLPKLGEQMFLGLFWKSTSPLVSGFPILLLFLAGIAFLVLWARRDQQWWAALVLGGAPVALIAGVIASSGAWSFHNYRYISASFPWIMAIASIGIALPLLFVGERKRMRRVLRIAALVIAAVVAAGSWSELRDNVRYFAQGVRDTNDQVVKIGKRINTSLPADVHIGFHDAGAISYYGDRPGTDILGLVTNHFALDANSGPGTRFENIEHIPVDRRPTHWAYYPGWLGTKELFGTTLLATPLRREVWKNKHKRRMVGGGNMKLMQARWEAVGTGHHLCEPIADWVIVDRIDVADRKSEAEHSYRSRLGPRRYGHPTARWSDVRTGPCGLLAKITDGGRVHREPGGESFEARVAAGVRAKLVTRTGGVDNHWSKSSKKPVSVQVSVNGKVVGSFEAQGAGRKFTDSVVDIPSEFLTGSTVVVKLDAVPFAPYRSFQHFVLQPKPTTPRERDGDASYQPSDESRDASSEMED